MPPSDDPEVGQIGVGQIGPDEVEPLSTAERWRLGVALMFACALIAVAERLPNPSPGRSLPRSLWTRPSSGTANICPESVLPRCIRELTSTPDAAA
jgi:hypothetical protein